jgi:hypothetical protein
MKGFLVAAFLIAASASPAVAQSAPTVSPAIDGIFDAFKTHPLVGLGEHHRIAQELDFYAALVRDPRFAGEVGNVVVEFGGAAHQDIIDRYVAGEEVPYTELRKVWTDTVGWIPVVSGIGYANFFAEVRGVNRALPPEQRIRVWLGDPVIDWDKIKSQADWKLLERTRDSFPAALIERQILARGKKALIIYGAGHFTPTAPGPVQEKLDATGWWPTTWRSLIDRDHPGALFFATFYSGAGQKPCIGDFEKTVTAWPVPALVVPFRGSALADNLRRCNPIRVEDAPFPPGNMFTDEEKKQAIAAWFGPASDADALLYLGPSGSLTYSPFMPDRYLDMAYARMVAKRYTLQTGQPYGDYPVSDYTAGKKVRP